jgi:hypothetical protein
MFGTTQAQAYQLEDLKLLMARQVRLAVFLGIGEQVALRVGRHLKDNS